MMPSTYTPLATTTTSSTVTEITFSGISGTYTDLILTCAIKPSNTSAPSVLAQFNSDTGSNYSETRLQSNGSTASSARRTSVAFAYLLDAGLSGTSTNTISNVVAQINNYSNTTTFKTVLSRGNTADLITEAIVNRWASTSAITSIKVFVVAGGFASGSTFSLYGIKAA